MIAPRTPTLAIDGDRLSERLGALAEIGAIEGGGCSRLALTDDDRRGRDLVVTWMSDLGIAGAGGRDRQRRRHHPRDRRVPRPRDDRLAHRHGAHRGSFRRQPRRAGRARGGGNPPVGGDRHSAGRCPSPSSPTRRASRFAPDMLGSLVYAGGLAVEDALGTVGIDGARLGDELARIGYQGPHSCPGSAPHAYVELHIEQGPVLEAADATIGVVTGVQGISWEEVTLSGQSNHAGTTPMTMRRDAGYAAAEIAVFARRLAADLGGHQVGDGRAARPPSRPRQRRRGPGRAHRRPPQHRRGRAAGGRALASPPSSWSWPSAKASPSRRVRSPASRPSPSTRGSSASWKRPRNASGITPVACRVARATTRR